MGARRPPAPLAGGVDFADSWRALLGGRRQPRVPESRPRGLLPRTAAHPEEGPGLSNRTAGWCSRLGLGAGQLGAGVAGEQPASPGRTHPHERRRYS